MTIQFGGLSTGLDTKSLISQLMQIEQQPITRLQQDQTWLNNRLKAFTDLDAKLKSFDSSIASLGNADTLQKRAISQSSSDYFTSSGSSDALAGTSYQVEVISLAQVQKSISATGFTSKTDTTFGTGTLKLTVGGTSNDITISSSNNSLTGIMQAINSANLGVSASIVNDGSSTPYRLALTGGNVGKTFSLDSTGLTGGTTTLGAWTNVQTASKAEIKVDSIDILSSSNTITDAIPGVTLNLVKAQQGTTTNVNINLDNTSIKASIQAFAKGYNDVVSFVTGQSVIDKKGGGVLGGDSGINAIKRHLQDLLTQTSPNSGSYTSLSQLGFKTQKDGTLIVDDTMLSKAINTNIDSVTKLLAGENGKGGIATQAKTYLDSMTDSSKGMLKGRQDSITANLKQIAEQITNMQSRLDQKQKTLESQFTAMEKLVSGLNSQSSYLTQQMNLLNNITTGSKS